MKKLLFVMLLLSGSFLMAQDSKSSTGQETIQGCVGRSNGDYVLTKQNPGITYELQATHGIKLRKYMGQRVEVTGNEGPTMSTSSDAINKTGNAAPVTLTVNSIRTIDKDCTVRPVSDR